MLKAPDVPSVLIELGYVSNKQDLKLMTSDAWRGRTSDALAQARDDLLLDQARRLVTGTGVPTETGHEAGQDPKTQGEAQV